MKRSYTSILVMLSVQLLCGTGCTGNKQTATSGLGPLESIVFTGNQDNWSGHLVNGTYVLENHEETGGIRYFYTSFDKRSLGERSAKVNVRIDGGDGSGRAGLLYGYQNSPKTYYMILASATGDIEIYRRDDTGIHMTMGTSHEPKEGYYHLDVLEKGHEVQVLVDGDNVSSFSSEGTGAGALGIAAMGLGRFTFTGYRQSPDREKSEQVQSTFNRNVPTDILRLKRFEVVDRHGFGKPIVAMTFLAPVGWKMEGGITWNVSAPCVYDLVSAHVRVAEPNGERAFEIFPKYNSQWYGDPQYSQMMAASNPCRMAPPLSSAEFISRIFVPGFRPNARVLETEPRPQAAEAQRAKVMAFEGAEMAKYQVQLKTDAAQSRIVYESNAGKKEEWVLATTTLSQMPVQGVYGGSTPLLSTFVENVLGFMVPQSEMEKNKALFATIVASYRVNPVYEKAVRDVLMTVNQIRVSGQIAQINRIRQQTAQLFDDWNAGIDRRDAEWSQRMAASDRVNRQFTEAIRGTQTLSDPDDAGRSWELPNDYQYVWKTPLDEFIMTNDINFNPNVVFDHDNWQKMQTAR